MFQPLCGCNIKVRFVVDNVGSIPVSSRTKDFKKCLCRTVAWRSAIGITWKNTKLDIFYNIPAIQQNICNSIMSWRKKSLRLKEAKNYMAFPSFLL